MTGIHSNNRKEQQEIKRLLGEYALLRVDQLIAYFHYKEESVVRNILGYLSRNEFISKDDTFVAMDRPTLEKGPDSQIISAFWVLLSQRKKVEYDTRGAYPAQIYFFADGMEYEIVCVAYGDENRVSAILSRREEEETHYIVIVEQPRQLEIIDIPRARWFCTVDGNGKITKYIQED